MFVYLCSVTNDKQLKKIIMKFTKTFDIENYANIYTTAVGVNTYELYRERTFKSNGTSKCDGDWIVQKNGQILSAFPTLKKAKTVVLMDSLN